MLRLCLLRVERIVFILNSDSINYVWRLWFQMFVAVWVLSRLVGWTRHGDRARIQFYLEVSLLLNHLLIIWIHGLARNLIGISPTRALCLESLRNRIVLNTESKWELRGVVGHLNSFLRNYEAFALCLASSIRRGVILRIYKLGFFAFTSVWVSLLRERYQLSKVYTVRLQQLGFVWNVLKCDWTWRYVNSLSRCTIHNLSCTACLAAIILTRMIWLLNSSVRSCVLFWDLIQNSSNGAFSCVVLLLGSALVNFSHWRRALALRVAQNMRGHMWVLLLCRKLPKYLLRLFLTHTLLSCKNRLCLLYLKLGGMLLLLH